MYILLASAENAHHHLLAAFLEEHGYQVESAATEGNLFWMIHKKKIDLVILGHFSTDESITDVLQRLRKDPEGKSMRVLVHTREDIPTARASAVLAELEAKYLRQPDFDGLLKYLENIASETEAQ